MALDLQRMADVAALERPAAAKRMLVIVNPYATTMSDRLKHLVVYALQGRYEVHAVDTQRRGHATELCREAAREGYDVVDATEHLLNMADAWEPRRADLGRVNGRWFTFAAGMGLDASVVERVDAHPDRKTRWGAWYFSEMAVRTFLRRYVVRPPRLEVEAGGRTIPGVSVFLQNAEPYTYFKQRPVNLVEGAALDSGDLAGVVLTRASPVDVPTITFRALSGAARIARHAKVEAFAGVDQVTVRSTDGRAVPLQVDGDHIGDAEEATFTVDPGALRVVA
jgi:diacylglycerol kinase family enzyme